MKILHLTLKKKWFDMIASGEKKEEYREIKEYWDKRLLGKNYHAVQFRNGYSKNAPTILVKFKGLRIGRGKRDWGWDSGSEVYVLTLGEILQVP